MMNFLMEYTVLSILFYISIYIVVLSLIGFGLYVLFIIIHNKFVFMNSKDVVECIIDEIDQQIHRNLGYKEEIYTAREFDDLKDTIKRRYL